MHGLDHVYKSLRGKTMDALAVNVDLGIFCEMKVLSVHRGLVESTMYGNPVVKEYIDNLYNNGHGRHVRIYRNGDSVNYVGFLKPNRSGILKSMLQVNKDSTELYLLVEHGNCPVFIKRPLRMVKLKTGLTKPSSLTRELTKVVNRTPPLKDCGFTYDIPKEWLRELGHI